MKASNVELKTFATLYGMVENGSIVEFCTCDGMRLKKTGRRHPASPRFGEKDTWSRRQRVKIHAVCKRKELVADSQFLYSYWIRANALH